MECTYDESCDMFLAGACNTRAGIDARKYALCYLGRHYPEAVFQRQKQRLRERRR
jgi:hypothetical protein